MAERINSGAASKGRCSTGESVTLARHSPVDWGKIGAYLAMFGLIGGVIWQFADLSITVRNLGDDVKYLEQESENLARAAVETSVRVTLLERREGQPVPTSSLCPAVSNAKSPSSGATTCSSAPLKVSAGCLVLVGPDAVTVDSSQRTSAYNP